MEKLSEDRMFILKPKDAFAAIAFKLYEALERRGQLPKKSDYYVAYTRTLPPGTNINDTFLGGIFEEFNIRIPEDYTATDMSAGDVIMIKRGIETTYYYVDVIGFKKLESEEFDG